MVTNVQLERIMTDKNLVRNEGTFCPRDSAAKKNRKKSVTADDVPEYAKIAQKQNPLESIVEKFEANGYTPEAAFQAFDDDEDDLEKMFASIPNGLF